ncbi:MAG: hypothetical protein WC807_03560 [Hyphomicrobium sp.]|jgi:hypothetical protein
MLFGSRAFVFAIFLVLGVSFVAGPVMLFQEFGWETGFLLATHDSHLFLFFPTLGLVALVAFYLPACAFLDMYWRHVRFGRARLLLGLAAVCAASYWIGASLADSPYRPVWDLSPAALAVDKSEPAGCGTAERPCERIALLEGIGNVAAVSHSRLGLKELVRSCDPETLIDSEGGERKSFCFASTPLTSKPRLSTDAECCRAQQRYQQAIARTYQSMGNRSHTGLLQMSLLPLKVFFLLLLLGMSGLLAARHTGVAMHYPKDVDRIEIGVLVGAVAMMFFPLMSLGFVQTADALYGVQQDTGFKPLVPMMSFFFGAWALLLLLFFFRRHDAEVEMAAKFAGVAASTIAVIKYDLMVALMVRYLGSGAGEPAIIFLVSFAVISMVVLASPAVRRLITGDRSDV